MSDLAERLKVPEGATPRPWAVERDPPVGYDENGFAECSIVIHEVHEDDPPLAICPLHANPEADSALIVRAVNLHEALVRVAVACEAMAAIIHEDIFEKSPRGQVSEGDQVRMKRATGLVTMADEAREALAALRAECAK